MPVAPPRRYHGPWEPMLAKRELVNLAKLCAKGAVPEVVWTSSPKILEAFLVSRRDLPFILAPSCSAFLGQATETDRRVPGQRLTASAVDMYSSSCA